MISLQDWAEYYFKMGIYVNPPCLNINYSDRDAWSIFKQTLEDVKSYDWQTIEGFYGVSGKQGIRVLRLNIGKDRPLYRSYCIKKIFVLLNLERYPWVIDTQNALEIVINCESFFDAFTFDTFEDLLLIYKGNFTLPYTANDAVFYFNGVPTIKPTVIARSSLANVIEVLKKDTHFNKRRNTDM